MNLLPLAVRELQVATRRPSTRVLRMAFGGGGIGLTLWAFLVWGGSIGQPGPFLFRILVLLCASGLILTAVAAAADSISRERREETLGFLFLTSLSARDVMAGKLAAAAILPASILLAMFPGFAVCPLVGGLAFSDFWRGIAVLLVVLLFSLSASLWASSRCRDHRAAFSSAALLLLAANPLWLCVFSFEAAYAGNPARFWMLFSAFTAGSLAFLGLAANALSRLWRDQPVRETVRQAKARASFTQSARGLLGANPVAWMLLRRRPARALLFAGGLAVAALFIILQFDLAQPSRQISLLLLALALHLGLEIWILGRTAYSFYQDRRDGSLELLLSTPLAIEQIFTGFNRFLLRQSQPLLLIVTGFDACLAALLLFSGAGPASVFPLAMAATLWISLFGAAWLGVFRSLMTNHPSLSMLGTFARLSLVPLLLSALFLWAPRTDLLKVAVFWIASAGFLALFFALDAHASLLKHGRELLLRPAGQKPPHIENEWTFIDWSEFADPPRASVSVTR